MTKHQLKAKLGFTLVELLVVITIIGILATLTMTGFTSARKSARDVTRKNDLSQYRTALENYSANNTGAYPANPGSPVTNPTNSCTGTTGSIFDTTASTNPIVDEYLPNVIHAPNEPTTCSPPTGFAYYYLNGGTTATYTLYAPLETGGFFEICSSGKSCQIAGTTAPTTCNCP